MYPIIAVIVLAALWVQRLSYPTRAPGNNVIGMASALGVSVEVLLARIGGGFNVDLFSYLFRSILVISEAEMWMSILVSLSPARGDVAVS